jgi:hypothetical protein
MDDKDILYCAYTCVDSSLERNIKRRVAQLLYPPFIFTTYSSLKLKLHVQSSVMSSVSGYHAASEVVEKTDPKLDIVDASITGLPAAEVGEVFEYPGDTVKEHKGELRRVFKARHIQMIVMGGCIGSGLFVSTGKASFCPLYSSCDTAPVLTILIGPSLW